MKAFALIEVLLVMAVVAVAGTWAVKPDLIPGTEAHRAKQAAKATQAVNDATAKVDTATQKQGSAVAASVTKISEANANAPASPSRDFIASESSLALSMLPAPDAINLAEAERRRAAVMQGERDEARRLYELASKKADQLQQERDEALRRRDLAVLDRQHIDQQYAELAAAEHARTMQAIGFGSVSVVALLIIGYLKLYGIGPSTLGKMVADIRGGADPIQTFDTHLAPWLHTHVSTAAKLATPLQDPPSNA